MKQLQQQKNITFAQTCCCENTCEGSRVVENTHLLCKSLKYTIYTLKQNVMATRWKTYGVLDAASRLAEQLRLGVVHLRGVENLLTLHLVQVQGAAEPQGG